MTSCHKLSHLLWLSISCPLYRFLSPAIPSLVVVHFLPTVQVPVTSYPISCGCPFLAHCTVSCYKLSHLSWLSISCPLYSFLSQAIPPLVVVHSLPTVQFPVTNFPISRGFPSLAHRTVHCRKLYHHSNFYSQYCNIPSVKC